MNEITLQRESEKAVTLPEPRTAVSIRVAGADDLAFIDGLQRTHSQMVGWFPRQQLESYIAKGQVLIAESGSTGGTPDPLGYCISSDRYFKRDDCGIVYQLNVAPSEQRGLIGATLIKAVFDRAPYGCKLFCCWCAQDLEANCFWESLGFVPLAFRTGARRAGKRKQPRIHIFWQRRIREGDSETPYWFPSETTGGAVRENRIALPIPPGTHWSDAKPAVLPGIEEALNALPDGEAEAPRPKRTPQGKKGSDAAKRPSNGLWFAPPEATPAEKRAAKAAQKKAKQPRRRNDPKLVAAARELRDRYIEQINDGLLLPPSACGKYDVSRALEGAPTALKTEEPVVVEQQKLLDAA